MNYVYISIGTNLFDKIRNLKDAIRKISDYCKIIEISSIYESEPYGYEFQNTFLNISILASTSLNPFSLLAKFKKIENLMGRKNLFKYSPRIIDIDILLFNEVEIETENLIIPHPEIYSRSFFVIPTLEIISKGFRSLNFDINKINFRNGWLSKIPHRL